ncbi:tail fiber assembly protein [Proteus terrae]|uniref:tail fiber assembly protein n=1 Tax=Proteus terrae TaxID=1574161 RepID=UPI001BAE1B35|nr:tail fiber assembly protein [Proteus terrae]QUT00923.1 tail fiber assembly protein [Proteus terrae subsp. cibarius]
MLLKYNNFIEYKPDNPKFGENVVYLKSDCGKDWYSCMHDFSKDTLKIEFSDDSKIVRVSYDVSKLFPINRSVAEVYNIPLGFNLGDEWCFLNGRIEKKCNINKKYSIERMKSKLFKEASYIIDSLEEAKNKGYISQSDISKIDKWKEYRYAVFSIDASNNNSNIQFPDKPS